MPPTLQSGQYTVDMLKRLSAFYLQERLSPQHINPALTIFFFPSPYPPPSSRHSFCRRPTHACCLTQVHLNPYSIINRHERVRTTTMKFSATALLFTLAAFAAAAPLANPGAEPGDTAPVMSDGTTIVPYKNTGQPGNAMTAEDAAAAPAPGGPTDAAAPPATAEAVAEPAADDADTEAAAAPAEDDAAADADAAPAEGDAAAAA
ncbi:hypothetical protein B0J12DRAFT_88681 [Macrophomina phaseolina]|uniref:Uncharacterized protein n=1 Tax=Macrophomina phaseolina TaxID=35725 RepID=A0ABQ8GDI7_9PEZI|nr:hypothetical protein B0J12DRAFT_88681 [Macrophomina phaseolina]